jgi:hypothetical protein
LPLCSAFNEQLILGLVHLPRFALALIYELVVWLVVRIDGR